MLGVQVVDVSDYSRIRGKILYSSFLSIKKGKNHFAKVNPILHYQNIVFSLHVQDFDMLCFHMKQV